jgi:hypothetical protein
MMYSSISASPSPRIAGNDGARVNFLMRAVSLHNMRGRGRPQSTQGRHHFLKPASSVALRRIALPTREAATRDRGDTTATTRAQLIAQRPVPQLATFQQEKS